jgi:hypothetical protein
VRFLDYNSPEAKIIFNHEHDLIVRHNIVTIVTGFIDHFINDLQIPIFNTFIRNAKGIEQRIDLLRFLIQLQFLNGFDALGRFTNRGNVGVTIEW